MIFMGWNKSRLEGEFIDRMIHHHPHLKVTLQEGGEKHKRDEDVIESASDARVILAGAKAQDVFLEEKAHLYGVPKLQLEECIGAVMEQKLFPVPDRMTKKQLLDLILPLSQTIEKAKRGYMQQLSSRTDSPASDVSTFSKDSADSEGRVPQLQQEERGFDLGYFSRLERARDERLGLKRVNSII